MTSPGNETTGWLRRHRCLVTGALLMLAAWALYLPTVRYGFVYYDDVRILRDHPELYGNDKLSADLQAIFKTGFPREEPLMLRDVSWALDSQAFGFGNAFGYHFGNVLLHGIVVALMFTFLLGTTRRYGFALATAGAFLLLGVHVEPVAWIMGRKDILSGLFMLLALCAQTQRLTTTNRVAQWGWYAATLLGFVAALLSKISVLTFPLVLLLHAVCLPWLRGERPPAAKLVRGGALWREALLALPAFAVSGVIYVWYQRTLEQMGIFDRGYSAHGLAHLWNLVMVNPMGFWLYLRQIFLPAHLAVLYPWPAVQAAYAPWQIIVSLATVAAAVGAGLGLFRWRKDLFFYYAAFFVLMIPYLNLIFIGIWVAERYVYFSSFCALAIAVTLATELWERSQRAVRVGVAVLVATVVAANLAQTFSYAPAWRDAETLWQNHLALPRHAPKAYENLAAFYYEDFGAGIARHDQPRMAAALHKMTVVVQAGLAEYWPDEKQPPAPATAFLFFLKSLIEEVEGRPEAALQSLLTSDALHPKFDSTNLNLSRVYRKLAQAEADPQQKKIELAAARERFATYIQLVYRDRLPPPGVRAELAAIEQECSAAALP